MILRFFPFLTILWFCKNRAPACTSSLFSWGLSMHLGFPGKGPSQHWAACHRGIPWSCLWYTQLEEYPYALEVNSPKGLLLLCSFHWEGNELLCVWKSEALRFLGCSCFCKWCHSAKLHSTGLPGSVSPFIK